MSEPRYPMTVRFNRGRVRHLAREVADGVYATACGKRGSSVPAGAYRAMCAACMAKPNPIDCRSYPGRAPATAPDSPMDEFEAADDTDRRWE